jgi:hypothetical protein
MDNHIADVAEYFQALRDKGFRISDKTLELAIQLSK